ncbi:hypothetical protein C8R46DRAFT_364969 [Mycena filopes]|nr:hypothetical protein C8R46DRAFT_364969 [Mycena filopes]
MPFPRDTADLPVFEVAPYVGAWDLAVCAALLLQGTLYAQFAHYTAVNKHDSVGTKLFVAGLALLTTLKTIQASVLMWAQNVTHFRNPEEAPQFMATYWGAEISPLAAEIIAFYTQMFFCRRLWAISHNIYVVSLCLFLFVAALVSAIVSTCFVFGTSYANQVDMITAQLGIALSGDLLLTISTTCFLLRHAKKVLPRGPTATLLDSLIRLTLQSAAPALICAGINFVSVLILSSYDHRSSSAALMLACISNMVLPKLYAISAMWVLNSREELRTASQNGSMITVDLNTKTELDARHSNASHSGTMGSDETYIHASDKVVEVPRESV